MKTIDTKDELKSTGISLVCHSVAYQVLVKQGMSAILATRWLI